MTTGSAFVRIYFRIVFCTFCFFSICFLKGFFFQKQERLLDVYPKRFNEYQHDSIFYSLQETLVMSHGYNEQKSKIDAWLEVCRAMKFAEDMLDWMQASKKTCSIGYKHPSIFAPGFHPQGQSRSCPHKGGTAALPCLPPTRLH